MSTSSHTIPQTIQQADANQSGIVSTSNQTMPSGEKLFLDGISFSTAPSQKLIINDQTALMLANATINTQVIVDGNLVSFINLSEGVSGSIVEGIPGKVVQV